MRISKINDLPYTHAKEKRERRRDMQSAAQRASTAAYYRSSFDRGNIHTYRFLVLQARRTKFARRRIYSVHAIKKEREIDICRSPRVRHDSDVIVRFRGALPRAPRREQSGVGGLCAAAATAAPSAALSVCIRALAREGKQLSRIYRCSAARARAAASLFNVYI